MGSIPTPGTKNERSEFLCPGSVCPAADALGIERRNMSRRARRDSEPVTSPSRAGEARGEVDSHPGHKKMAIHLSKDSMKFESMIEMIKVAQYCINFNKKNIGVMRVVMGIQQQYYSYH